ncbi:MAG TPA: hypothetical protein DF292_04860, partial [Firmicutes bacterium]|nr:hypothetical protein [Bacillota bacterium]
EPTIALSSSGTKGAITLSWEISDADKVTSYYIYRGTSPTSLSKIATVAASGNTYRDTAVEDGILYYYHVTAFGKKESPPSNQIYNMHGTRLTEDDTSANFTAIVDDSPYVIENKVSFAGDLDIIGNTKLYVLPGAKVVFEKATAASIYVDRGLFVTKGTKANPIYFSSTGGGYELRMVLAAEGSQFDYTEFRDLAGAYDSQSVIISTCSPAISHCRFVSNAATASLYASGANITNCYFGGLDLEIEDSVVSTLNIESNIFVDNEVALMFSNYTSIAPEAGVIHNNAFECNGTSDESYYSADLTIIGYTNVACDFLLVGNYFFRSGNYNTALTEQGDFFVYYDSLCPNQTFNFDDLLTTHPTGIGPGWGTLPF